jgi:riboflavin kinase/FMN adenylyltransferase
MQVFHHFSKQATQAITLAIGNFDGVHLGHQALLKRLITTAQSQNLKSVVMTFEPHPREFFTPDQAPTRLTSLREKLELFAEAGVEQVYVCRFNSRFAKITAEDFMQTIMRDALNAQSVLVGQDFRFGAGRKGTVADFEATGFNLVNLPNVEYDGQRVSSTVVREALAKGDLDKAATLLGRPYSISGKVVHGDKLGRKLGYPTANVHIRHDRPPLLGVYAVKLEGLPGGELSGVASLGVRPTLKDNGKPVLEVHLFDFNQEIYGTHVRVKFLHKIRDEMKFADLDILKRWMIADEQAAREYLRT